MQCNDYYLFTSIHTKTYSFSTLGKCDLISNTCHTNGSDTKNYKN